MASVGGHDKWKNNNVPSTKTKQKMKTKILLAAALSMGVLAHTASAQRGLTLGVQGVAQNSWMFNKDNSDNGGFKYKTTFGPAFGVGAQFGLGDHIGVGMDLLYSIQGQRSEFTLQDVTAEQYQRNTYMKIPLMLVLNSDPDAGCMFQLKVGPQFSFLTNSKLEDKDGNDIVGDTKDAFNNTDIGGMLSLGAAFRITESLRFTTALRFDYGFTDAQDEDYEFFPADGAKTANATGGLAIGLTYTL